MRRSHASKGRVVGETWGVSPRASHDHGRTAERRALQVVLVVTAAFFAVEVVAGFAFGSLALLADAAHMLSDVMALGIALVAQSLSGRPSSPRHSFGLQRAEVLGAQANGILLVASAGWILVEAARRVGDAPEVGGTGLLVVASAGLVVNLACAAVLARSGTRSLNLRALMLHVRADAAASGAAIAAGIAIVVAGANWVDPAVSMLVGVMVLWAAWRLLRETTHVLLEGTPPGLDPDEVASAMTATPGVVSIHHLHLWNLASDVAALSAHVVLADDQSLHDAQQVGDDLRDLLSSRFGINHATFDLECHLCEPPPQVASMGPLGGGPGPRRRRRGS